MHEAQTFFRQIRILNMVRFFTWGLLMLFAANAYSQEPVVYPLRGKTVAVYLSKKQFTYDDNYLIPLSQFVKSDRDIAPASDDLKLQTLISLGRMFSQQLKSATHADSVFFLNETPVLAEKFLRSYRPDQHYCPPLDSTFRNVDVILVVNPLTLGSFKTQSVYTVSNRIVTEHVIQKSGRLRLDVIDARSGLILNIAEGCWKEGQKWPEPLFYFLSADSPTGKFLSALFTVAVRNLNEGVKSNCGE